MKNRNYAMEQNKIYYKWLTNVKIKKPINQYLSIPFDLGPPYIDAVYHHI